MKKIIFSVFLAAACMSGQTSFAQSALKLPALSPTAKISQEFSLSNIEISYSRPSIRGREIFGDVVAFGKPWRTGANGATKIKFGEDVDVMGTRIKAGEYVIYTIPGKDKWEVIFNLGTTPFGPEGYEKGNDVARLMIEPTRIANVCQTFTIELSEITYNTCKIDLIWEKTRVSIPVATHNEELIGKNIENAINHPNVPYFQAAGYIFESNGDIDKAKMLVDKALEQDPKAYYMWYLKARIEKKLGNKKDAAEAARKSMELAKGAALEAEYIHNNQKILDDLKN
jgi:Protein of unknown function (DUF2911)/Tetratricopeptide repeat